MFGCFFHRDMKTSQNSFLVVHGLKLFKHTFRLNAQPEIKSWKLSTYYVKLIWVYFLADKIRPACLPLKRSMDQDLSGRYMVAAGWGKQSDGKYLSCTIGRKMLWIRKLILLIRIFSCAVSSATHKPIILLSCCKGVWF